MSEQNKPKVFDTKIEELMQLATAQPLGESNIVGLGAMWLAAELFYLQEAQEIQGKDEGEKHSGGPTRFTGSC